MRQRLRQAEFERRRAGLGRLDGGAVPEAKSERPLRERRRDLLAQPRRVA